MSKVVDTGYKIQDTFLLSVDCVVFCVAEGKLNIMLLEKESGPLAGQWSLLGTFASPFESVSDAAQRVLKQVADPDDIYSEQLYCFGEQARTPDKRVVSVAYWCLVSIGQVDSEFSVENHKAKWVELEKIPELILDHDDMVQMAIKRLREKARFYPIGFELVKREFTLLQLLKVYEAIFDRKIDDRNFRKKILKSGLLIPLNKKDKSTSRKGSYLYEFNQATYSQLQRKGYNFEF